MPEVAMKTGWARVAFGDVAQLSRERSGDPEQDGLDRYVGLEHIDPGDLTIRRWGDVVDGTTFTSVFRPGHVLFGKRRAYQRKLAVADFSGVCSGDLYVLEPKDSRLLPELLPFICQADEFFNHAVTTSAGSLSPRTNWDSLASYEFALPPLGEQWRIAKVLRAGRAVTERLQEAELAANALYTAASANQFARPETIGVEPKHWARPGWTCRSLEELVVASAPICYGIVQVGDDDRTGIPTVAIKDLKGDFSRGVHRSSPAVEARYARSRIQTGDVLISIKATIGEIAVVPVGFAGNISRDLARLRFDQDKVRARFFVHLYRSPRYTQYVNSRLVGSTRAELSIGILRQLAVPVPPLDQQDRKAG